MRFMLPLAALLMASHAMADEESRICGNYSVDDGPGAPRAAFRSALELGEHLKAVCRPGDVITLTAGGHYVFVQDLAAMWCDYSKQILTESAPTSGRRNLSCVYRGGNRGLAPSASR